MSTERERDPLVIGQVIGDVVDPFVKSVNLRLVYGTKEITNGSGFRNSAVVNQPSVDIRGNDGNSLYTLVSIFYH